MTEKVTASADVSGDLKWKRFYDRFPRLTLKIGKEKFEVFDPKVLEEEAKQLKDNPMPDVLTPQELLRVAACCREALRYAELAQISVREKFVEEKDGDMVRAKHAYDKAVGIVTGRSLDEKA